MFLYGCRSLMTWITNTPMKMGGEEDLVSFFYHWGGKVSILIKILGKCEYLKGEKMGKSEHFKMRGKK